MTSGSIKIGVSLHDTYSTLDSLEVKIEAQDMAVAREIIANLRREVRAIEDRVRAELASVAVEDAAR